MRRFCNLDTQQKLRGKKGGQCKGVQEGGKTNNNKTRWKKQNRKKEKDNGVYCSTFTIST